MIEYTLKSPKEQLTFDEFVDRAKRKCDELRYLANEIEAADHIYSMEVTKEELGLDDALIEMLLEEYVAQIIGSLPYFRENIKQILQAKKEGREADYSKLRDLAHKNLGVARNLRIQDAQKILHSIMVNDDVEGVQRCLEYLEACAVMLKPEVAYRVYSKQDR